MQRLMDRLRKPASRVNFEADRSGSVEKDQQVPSSPKSVLLAPPSPVDPVPTETSSRNIRAAPIEEVPTPESDDGLPPLVYKESNLYAPSTLSSTLPILNSPSRSGRSRSFDSAASASALASETKNKSYQRSSGTFLELPKWKMLVRKSSSASNSTAAPYERDCTHCNLMKELNKSSISSQPSLTSSSFSSSPSNSSAEDSDSDVKSSQCSAFTQSDDSDDDTGLDNSNLPIVTLSLAPEIEITQAEEDSGLTVISLEVPVLPKSRRSASVDSSYLQVPQRSDIGLCEPPPVKAQRSRSIDVALPVGPDGPYIVVPTEKPQPIITQ